MADLQIQGEVVVTSEKAEAAFERVGDKAEKMGADVAAAARKAGTEVDKMGDGAGGSAEKFTRSESRISDSIKRTTKRLEELGKTASQKLELQIQDKGLDPSKFEPLLKKLREAEAAQLALAKASATAGASATKAADSFSLFSGVIGAGFATIGVASLMAVSNAALGVAKSLYEASAAGERLRTMLDFASGGKGAKEIDYLREVTDRLGLSFQGTASAYGQFAAAAKGTALEGQKARDIFEAVSKASAVMGLSTEQSSGALLALQQMISKGTVQAEELRGQLGERLPGAFQIAAKAMGVTTGELGKMLEAGQVVADDFLPKFAKALEENLGGAAEKAAERLDASVNKYTNSWEKLKETIGDSGVSKAASNELRALANEFKVVSETMENVRKAGGGMFEELGAGGGVAVARAGFSAINLVANTLNGTINALTGNALGLRTNLALLPDVLKNNAQQSAALAADLKKAEAEFVALKAQSATMGSSIYYKSEIASLAQYIAKLKDAQNAKKDLTGNDPRDIPLSQGRGASYQKIEQEQAAAQKALNEERLKSAGITKDYISSIAVYQEALRTGIITEKQAVASIAELVKKQQERTDSARGIKSGTASEVKAYDTLIASIKEKTKATDLEAAGGQKLNEAEKMRLDITGKLDAGLLKLTTTQKKSVLAGIDALDVQLKLREAEKEAMKVAVARQQLQQKESDDIESYIRAEKQARIATAKAANDSVAAAQAEYDNYGKTKSQIAEVTLARLKDQLAGVNAGTAIAESLQAQITAQKQLIGILASGEAREINEKSAKDAADEWKKTAESIQNSITDALLRGFESGKGFGKNLRDTIVNMFKTLVLRPTISAIVNPVAGAITSSMGLAGTANAATGGSGILGTLSNLSSISTLTSAISTGVAGAVGSTVSSIFGTVAGNTALGTTLGLGTGSSLAAASAASVAGGGAAAGAGLTSITSALGAIGPAGWAAIAAIAAVSLLGGRGETRSGASYETDASGLAFVQQGPSGGEIAGEAARAAFDFTTQTIRDTLKAVGSKAVLTGFTAGLESSKNGKGFEFAGGKIDGVGFGEFDGRAGGQFAFKSQSSEAAFANYILQLKQSTIEALQAATDVPKAIQNKLAGVDAAALDTKAIDTLLTEINGFIASIASFQTSTLALPFENLKNLSFAAAAELADVSGGLENLKNSLGVYFDNFYSEEEKRTQKIKEINAITAGSGLDAATATRESFKALVNAQDLTTESGRKTYASLLSVAGSFASITPDAEAAAASVDAAADSVKKVSALFLSLSKESENLQIELLDAQGNKQGAATARRAQAISSYTQAEIDDGAIGLFDYNESLREQIAALKATAAAMDEKSAKEKARAEEIKAERKSIEDQITALTDTEAQALERQRAALDSSSQARFDELQSIKATAAAIEANKSAMQSFNAGIAGTIAKFSTPEEARAAQYSSIASGLKAAGLASSDYASLAVDLQDASKDQVKAAAQSIFDGLGAKAGVAKESLRVFADQLADLKNAEATESISAINRALEGRTKAQNDAFSVLERSVSAERKAAQTRADLAAQTAGSIKSIFELLKSSVRDLYGEVESTRNQSGREGQAFIDNALTNAQTTGYLPDQAALEDAIAASRRGIESTIFASQTDQDIARLELAGKLSQLKDISGRQLTEAEQQAESARQQLEYFDNLLTSERAQLDALQGLNTSVLSVPQALAALLSTKISAPAPQPVLNSASASPGGILSTSSNKVSDYSIEAMIYGTRGRGEDGNRQLYDWAMKWKDSGVTLARLNEVANVPAGTAEEWAKANGLPTFAKGGTHKGGWALVGEDGPEVAYIPPARIYSAPDTQMLLSGSGSNEAIDRLTSQIEVLTKELEKVTENTGRTSEAVNGRPDRPMIVEMAV